jgi:cellulose synthase operon protein C
MAKSSRKPNVRVSRPATSRQADRVRRLNLPLLVGTLVGLAVLLPGLYLWRARQVEQSADAFAARAEALAKEGEWSQSAEYLFLYLRMRPDDQAVRVRLAETYDHLAIQRPQLRRAVELYYQALAAAPTDQQPSLRRRLVELLLQSEQFASAAKEADALLKGDEENAEGNRLKALALYGQANAVGIASGPKASPDVGDALEKARRLNPADVQLAWTLAEVYRDVPQLQSEDARKLSDSERAQLADRCLDDLVQADPKQAMAYLARFQYRKKYKLPSADTDLDQAVKLSPEDLVVLMAAADHLERTAVRPDGATSLRRELLEQAGKYYERAIAAQPLAERAYLGLGEIQARQDQSDQAIKTWELGLEKCGANSIALNLRLAEAQIALGDLGRAERCIESVQKTAANLRQQGVLESQLSFARLADVLKARLYNVKQNTDGAIAILKPIADGPKGNTAEGRITYQALMLLGTIYATQGQQKLAVVAFDNAATAQPQMAEPHLAAAAVWINVDLPELACKHLETVIAIDGSMENRLLLAGATLRAQLKLAASKRDWSTVEKLLQETKQSQPQLADSEFAKLNLLEAEYLLHSNTDKGDRNGGIKAALDALRAAENSALASGDAAGDFALAYERLGAAADADRVLESLRKRFPKAPDTYLRSAAILTVRKQYPAAREVLEQGVVAVGVERRLPVQLGLVDLFTQQGLDADAWQSLSELQRQMPSDRALLERTLDFAIDHERFAEAETLEKSLHELKGVTPQEWQFHRARRLIRQATAPTDPSLTEAKTLVSEIKQERPTWPSAHLLWGEFLERSGNPEKAADAYQEAIRLGEQRLMVYERLILLLFQLERFSEADKYLAELSSRSATSAGLSTAEISLALRAGQLDKALEAARLGTTRRPTDPLAQVWLGQLLLAAGKPAEAEKSLRRALELGPTDPRAYGAVVNYFIRTKQLERAGAAVEQFSRRIDVPEVQRELVRAAGYQAIGDRDRALSHYRKAEQLEPQNSEVQERIGAILVSSDPAAAEKALRRALELNPQSTTARQALVKLLGSGGGEQRWKEALAILEEPGSSVDKPQQLDRRLQALLHANRGGPDNLAKAVQILSEILADPNQTPSRNDRLLLARVYEAHGKADAARNGFLALANEQSPRSDDIAAYVEYLLRHDSLKEAETWLGKLDQLDPNNLTGIGPRVRLLAAQGDFAKVEGLLEQTAKRLLKDVQANSVAGQEREVQVSLTIGDLYTSVKQFPAAERWYMRAYRLDATQYNRLARSLANQGRGTEAVQLCLDAADLDTSYRPALSAVNLALRTGLEGADVEKVEALVTKALATYGDVPELLTAAAALRIVQQQFDEACTLYRHLLELQPQNVGALNDLATALAEQQGHGEEALETIDRAIQLAGAQPNLLDTKGTILLSLGKVKEGVALLSEAAAAPDPDPRFHLHLAIGHYRAGDLIKAREFLAIARKGELSRQILTKSDTSMLAELDERLR